MGISDIFQNFRTLILGSKKPADYIPESGKMTEHLLRQLSKEQGYNPDTKISVVYRTPTQWGTIIVDVFTACAANYASHKPFYNHAAKNSDLIRDLVRTTHEEKFSGFAMAATPMIFAAYGRSHA